MMQLIPLVLLSEPAPAWLDTDLLKSAKWSQLTTSLAIPRASRAAPEGARRHDNPWHSRGVRALRAEDKSVLYVQVQIHEKPRKAHPFSYTGAPNAMGGEGEILHRPGSWSGRRLSLPVWRTEHPFGMYLQACSETIYIQARIDYPIATRSGRPASGDRTNWLKKDRAFLESLVENAIKQALKGPKDI